MHRGTVEIRIHQNLKINTVNEEISATNKHKEHLTNHLNRLTS